MFNCSANNTTLLCCRFSLLTLSWSLAARSAAASSALRSTSLELCSCILMSSTSFSCCWASLAVPDAPRLLRIWIHFHVQLNFNVVSHVTFLCCYLTLRMMNRFHTYCTFSNEGVFSLHICTVVSYFDVAVQCKHSWLAAHISAVWFTILFPCWIESK